MSNKSETLNEKAWIELFNTYNILEEIDKNGSFVIEANQIRKLREPRLMCKFDHAINLPDIFSKNNLSILPITRGNYIISRFETYYKFEEQKLPVIRHSLPQHIQSLDINNISSESIALNCAAAAGIIKDFLGDDELIPTVSGRMSSKSFDFKINDIKGNFFHTIKVVNSQIEIDAAYEGINSLALFEAKRDLSKDFLIRQLYYPYRVWRNNVTKKVRPIFMIYSNGIYRLYEFDFEDYENYNSLILLNHKHYSIEDTVIAINDIQNILSKTKIEPEGTIPFPQADSFERVINICELLNEQELTSDEITVEYAFDKRQTDYYTNAGLYLGLLEKTRINKKTTYKLNDRGKKILSLNFKNRQLAFCEIILSHRVFNQTLRLFFDKGKAPENEQIMNIMRSSNLHKMKSDSTFERRASTVKSWVSWIINLTSEYD